MRKNNLFIIFIFIYFFPQIVNAKNYELFTDLFYKDKVESEFTAYRLLKQTPLKENINYLAIPWAVLLNTNQLHKIPKIKLNGGFTICQHVHYEKIIPILKRIGIDTLFTPHVNKTYEGIKVLPFPHLAIHGALPKEKDLWYSFIGLNTHWTRRYIFDHFPAREDVIIKERKKWHFDLQRSINEAKQMAEEKAEYQDVLARSRFSLCPRGVGPSTIRFWESLQAGAIPVLISDDMMLPNNFDWQRCIVRIPEHKVDEIESILAAIPLEQEQLMRQACLEAYSLFSGKNFVKVIRDHYDPNKKTNLDYILQADY